MLNRLNILIVEDERNISNFIAASLTNNNYKVVSAYSGREAISLITSYCPELVLLDLNLPDMDGLEVLKYIRGVSNIPVIVISAKREEETKVQALDMGADDYLTKPFGISELLARIRTALRHNSRMSETDNNIYKYEDLTIDFEKRLVLLNGEMVHLTQNEYKIVVLLAKNAGRVLTYDAIITQIWGPHNSGDNRILRVNMANIRREFEKNPADPHYIFTEVGTGYRMAESEK